MTEARRPPPHEAAVDGLRALALLPVVAVNWVGYAALPDAGPLAAAQPGGSWWAEGWLFAVAAMLAGKGIALLTFLFGYGQGLSQRARGAQASRTRRRRMGRLLLLGLAHGLFIYAGDILTLYAACGWLMLGWSRLRLRQLLRRAVILFAVHSLIVVIAVSWVLTHPDYQQERMFPSLAAPSHWPGWLATNAGGFAIGQLNVLLAGLFLPLALMTAGLVAARLRLFSHPRWRSLLARFARRWFWPGLVANLAWGLALCLALAARRDNWAIAAYAINGHVAPLWLLGLVPWLVLAAQRRVDMMSRLALLGRHTLSLYIGSSLLSLAVLSGAGLALPLRTAPLALLALLYWVMWLVLAQRLRGRLPLERWLSR